MKSLFTVWIVMAGMAAATVSFADIYEVRENDGRVFEAPFSSGKPIIDGNIEDATWGNAASFSGFRRYSAGLAAAGAHADTVLSLTYDDQNLYVAFKCFERDISSLRAFAPCDGIHDLRDDRVEIFLNLMACSGAAPHVIIVNCNGVTRTSGGGTRDGWRPDIKTAHGRGADYWTLEIAIPLSEMGKDNLKGEICGLNVTRMHSYGITALVPTKPGESFKNNMMRVYFAPPGDSALKIISTTRGALALDGFVTGANRAQYSIHNDGGGVFEVVFDVENIVDGKSMGKISKEILINDLKEELAVYYNVLGQNGETIVFSARDKNTGECLYTSANAMDILNPIYRVYRIENPLFDELLDCNAHKNPGFIGNRAGIAPIGFRFSTFKTALRFGAEYSLDKLQQQLQTAGFHTIGYASWAEDVCPVPSVWKKAGQPEGELPLLMRGALEKGWSKPIFYANYYVTGVDKDGNPGPNIRTGFGYTFDPINARAYIDSVENVVKKHGDHLWAVYVGDEQSDQNRHRLIAEMKQNFDESDTNSFYYKINMEVKNECGFGKFGIPFDIDRKHPDYPFRRSAFIRWMQSRIRPINRRIREVVKAIDPDMPILSENLMAGLDGDLTVFDDYADIGSFQLIEPYYTQKQSWTFRVKYVKDLSGLDCIMAGVHEVTGGYQAGFSNPEESLELYSQVIRGGAGGISAWLASYPSPYPPIPDAQSVVIGHPYAWDYMIAIAKTINALPPLKFPAADSAVLVSMDSIHCEDERYPPWARLQRYDDVFAQLGVNSRAWFKFVATDRLLAGKDPLDNYKAVYMPDIKYTTPEVIEKLRAYAANGGTLICLGPDAFEYNLNAESLAKFREEIFGVALNGKTGAKAVAFDMPGLKISIPLLDLNLNKLKITDPGKVSVIATFDNGDSALTEKKIGAGRALYFAFMPINDATTKHDDWKKFWTDFHVALGCAVGHDIWRFKLPAPEISSRPVPSTPASYCLTGNYGFWSKGYFYGVDSRFNLPLQGLYTVAIRNDKAGSHSFRDGKLTDRLKAAEYSKTLAACGLPDNHIYLQPEKWVEVFNGKFPVVIDFRFAHPCLVQKAVIYLNGEFNGVELAVSADGKIWKKAGAVAETFKTGEYEVSRVEAISGAGDLVKYARLTFGGRAADDSKLTVAEVELWGDCPGLTGNQRLVAETP